MSLKKLSPAVLAAGVGVLACLASAGADKQARKTGDELTAAGFDKLHALIKPDAKRSFESVPWLTGLWAARRRAAEQDKPLVLWAGDPLPLGVT